ncbi:hypothetical protein AVEN_138434-1 [Araneus ventricosus]|uniref:Uncharacterized protein n=1 Tax=Araneus ventricosus TaxID=182803 RepID=A0A4Y2CEX6_ARAVE|nr:hypothetical protein AVEN_138434-1 [Araneus ventricosus]
MVKENQKCFLLNFLVYFTMWSIFCKASSYWSRGDLVVRSRFRGRRVQVRNLIPVKIRMHFESYVVAKCPPTDVVRKCVEVCQLRPSDTREVSSSSSDCDLKLPGPSKIALLLLYNGTLI